MSLWALMTYFQPWETTCFNQHIDFEFSCMLTQLLRTSSVWNKTFFAIGVKYSD